MHDHSSCDECSYRIRSTPCKNLFTITEVKVKIRAICDYNPRLISISLVICGSRHGIIIARKHYEIIEFDSMKI